MLGLVRGARLRIHRAVDGHDLDALVTTLRELSARRGPRVLHVRTQKGHGYARAEAEPIRYHGVTSFDPAAGIVPRRSRSLPTYTEVFGQWLCDAANADPRLLAVTPAMREGSGLVAFARQHPDRYFDVGIAEQHCVTFAAGLACAGARPVVAIYSTFLQRAYDQLVHDVALQDLPVHVRHRPRRPRRPRRRHAQRRDRPELPALRAGPGRDGAQRRQRTARHARDRAAARRTDRRALPALPHPRPALRCPPQPIPLGSAELRRIGSGRVAILAFGTLLGSALDIATELDATVVNMRFVKPLDESMVLEMARKHDLLVTLEENSLAGGAGSAVHECLMRRNVQVPLLQLGLPDRFIEHGTRDEALRDAGLDREGILQAITGRLPQVTRGNARVHAVPTSLPSARRSGGATRAVVAQKAD